MANQKFSYMNQSLAGHIILFTAKGMKKALVKFVEGIKGNNFC